MVLADELEKVMQVNSPSAEMMLARFFDTPVLAPYLGRLGKSGKGARSSLPKQ